MLLRLRVRAAGPLLTGVAVGLLCAAVALVLVAWLLPVVGVAQRLPVVLLLGDSLATGYGLAPEDAFPRRLALLARARGYPIRVVVVARNGATLADGAERIRTSVIIHRPDVVVVALGGNDLLRSTGIPVMREALDRILLESRAQTPLVLVAGMLAPPDFPAGFVEEFAAVFRDSAARHGAVLLPFLLDGVVGDRALNQSDGIHPNALGADRMAALVWVHLRPLLDRLPRNVLR